MKNLINPNYLFKFQKCNKFFFQSLKSNTFYFGSISKFNDPFESLFRSSSWNTDKEGVDYFYSHIFPNTSLKEIDVSEHSAIVKERMSSQTFDIQLLQDLEHSIYSYIKDFYGVVCFSEKFDELLMWSHYADAGFGVCQIFEKLDIFLNTQYPQPNISPVSYLDEIPVSGIKLESRSIKFDFSKVITTKRKNWEYEKEIRAYFNFAKLTPSIKTSRNQLESNQGSIRNIKYAPEKLKGIIFGHQCNVRNRNKIKRILKENKNIVYDDLVFYEAIVNTHSGQYFFQIEK